VVGVDAHAYRETFKDRHKKPSPEEFCFIRLMRLVMEETAKWTDPFPLNLVFDDSEHSMRFYKIYQSRKSKDDTFKDGVSGITFADDILVSALQAADLFACVSAKESAKPAGTWLEEGPFADILNAVDPAFGKLYRAEYWDKALFNKHAPQFLEATWRGEM